MIKNRDELAQTKARRAAIDTLESAVKAVHPNTILLEHLKIEDKELSVADSTYPIDQYDDIVVLGGGNAAGHVAAALEKLLGDKIDRGVVVTDDPVSTEHIEVFEADYPIPSERCMEGTRRVIDIAESLDSEALALVTLSGGGSPLLSAPVADISLADLQVVTNILFESGISLHEINAVRKHLSAIKGGQFARAIAPATTAGLVFSDVVGNDLGVIASGPLSPDDTTFEDALVILNRHNIDVPDRVFDRLRRGKHGQVKETPNSDSDVFQRVDLHVLADGSTALNGASGVMADQGYNTLVLSSRFRGEAHVTAKNHVAIAEEVVRTGNPIDPPAILLSGGETPVTARGQSARRPNQEFALSAALELDDLNVAIASIATDGHDGMTDIAGAVIDTKTVGSQEETHAAFKDGKIKSFLDNNVDLIHTGATGTNVNDIRVVVVEEDAGGSNG